MRIFQFYLHIPFLCFLLYNKEKSGFVSNWEKGGFLMKNLRWMLASVVVTRSTKISSVFTAFLWAGMGGGSAYTLLSEQRGYGKQ